MKVPLLDLKAQYKPLREDTKKLLDDILDSQYFIGGPYVAKLEAEVAALKEYRERLIADVVTGQRKVA